MTERFAPPDKDRDDAAIEALISGDEVTIIGAGGKIERNYDKRILAEVLEYFDSVALMPLNKKLKRAYEEAYRNLQNGDPEDAIEILNEDYSYWLGMDTEGPDSEKEIEKIGRFLDFLKNHFKKHQV